MSPRVPRLRWDDPFRALDMLASLWSSTGMSLVSAGAAQPSRPRRATGVRADCRCRPPVVLGHARKPADDGACADETVGGATAWG